ncbi:MAG: PH domain-containing protein [Actinomycetota bacterium]|nr:PH domain-containing protein [Actinomycetota bacterium]
MPTLEEVKAQIQQLDNFSKVASFREIRELPNILWEDEVIEKMIQGTYGSRSSIGVLVATNKRLCFVDKGLVYGVRVEDFAYDQITSMEYKTGLLLGRIIVYSAGNRAEIVNCEKAQVQAFTEYVRARTSGRTVHASAPQQSALPDSDDPISRLERLAGLKERGILTDAEFQAEKRKILET